LPARLQSQRTIAGIYGTMAAIVVLADPARLFQIFTNLIENAVKYTPPRGRIWVKATFDDTDAIVHVEDNGKGIAPELLPRVFDMFTQGDTTTSGGTGCQPGLGQGQ